MDTINDNLSLTVINDGDGSQCGFNYRMRCAIFSVKTNEAACANAALRMVQSADAWMKKRGHKGETALVMLAQAYEVMDYYIDHLADQYNEHDTGAA